MPENTPKSPLLFIDNLHVSTLLHRLPILNGVTLSINHGESIALVGPSGSGKSLTAMAILGLLPKELIVTSGTIVFGKSSLLTLHQHELRNIRGKKIAMIFQDPLSHLNPTMTVGNQIAEMLTFHKKFTKREAKEVTYQLLEDVGIPSPRDRYNFYPFEMSGGQRQRVLIALALSCNPDLLLADEPTTALDPIIQTQILELINNLVKKYNMSLLFITHDLRVANVLADKIAVMHQGAIVEIEQKDAFLSHQKHPQSQALVAQYRRRYFVK